MIEIPVEPLSWHRGIWSRLGQARAAGRLSHALMLHGPAGLGKGLFARQFAASLLCISPDELGFPCGRCRSCALTVAGNHPDLHILGVMEDKAYISVDQVRALLEDIVLGTLFATPRVVIIDPADRLNHSAANSLLKMLEEPVGAVQFLLVLKDITSLPATIFSRCQRLGFTMPEYDVADQWLASWVGNPDERSQLLAITNHAPFAAKALAEKPDRPLSPSEMLKQIVGLLAGDDPLSTAGDWLKSGANYALYSMYTCIAGLITLKSTSGDAGGFSGKDLAALHGAHLSACSTKDLAQFEAWSVPGLYRQLDRINRALRLLPTQVNQQLLLEELAIYWTRGDDHEIGPA